MHSSNANECLDSHIWLENGSQEEYGCHLAQFTNNLREKKCVYCDQRKPALLEELAFSAILENEELFERLVSALYHFPQRICWLIGRAINANLLSQVWQLVGFVSDFGKTRRSWFDVDECKAPLLSKFRLYCKVHQKLKPYVGSGSAGIDEILHYLSNFDTTYEDFWSKMISAITKLKAETDSEDFGPLKSKVCSDENNVVLIKVTKWRKVQWNRNEYESMKELQRLNKTFSCPVVFKPTTIQLNVESNDIEHLLDDIDPKMIADVGLEKTAWSVADVDQLAGVLSSCSNLSVIYLRQKPTINQVQDNVAPAVSRLLSQHNQLQEIELAGFDFAGTFAKYPLPPVEELLLLFCTYTKEDLDSMASRSDLALKTLVFCSLFYDDRLSSLPNFIQSQAKSLTTLVLAYPIVSSTDICKLLRILAKANMLKVLMLFCQEEIDFISIERIIVDLMSIHSTRCCFIDFPTDSSESDLEADINHIKELVTKLCKINRRSPIYVGVNTLLPK